jgi:predicted nucleic acid-binding protein
VAVDHLRGVPAATALLRELTESGDEILASEVVRFELLAGVRKSEFDALEAFFEALSGWVPVDEDIARSAGDLARRYRPRFTGIDTADYLIAATTLTLGAELLTTNVRHFPMISGLRSAY